MKLPMIIYMKTVSSIAHYDFLCICMGAFTTQELRCVTSNVNSECLWLKSSVAFKELQSAVLLKIKISKCYYVFL